MAKNYDDEIIGTLSQTLRFNRYWCQKKEIKKEVEISQKYFYFLFCIPLLNALVTPQCCHIPQVTIIIIITTKIIAIPINVTFSLKINENTK